MGFRFTLAAVLRLREIAEEREERLLSSILRKIAQTRQAIEDVDAALLQMALGHDAGLSSTMVAGELQSFYERREILRAARRSHEEQLVKLEELRRQQLAIYQQAHRGRRMLTDMRMDQRAAWHAERSRLEQKAADDLFLARRSRTPAE